MYSCHCALHGWSFAHCCLFERNMPSHSVHRGMPCVPKQLTKATATQRGEFAQACKQDNVTGGGPRSQFATQNIPINANVGTILGAEERMCVPHKLCDESDLLTSGARLMSLLHGQNLPEREQKRV
jgi:hypothetical protein